MTAFRSQTDEMLAAKYDPEPWAYSRLSRSGSTQWGTPDRAATRIDSAMLFIPRPEFIPSRDELPWRNQDNTARSRERSERRMFGGKFEPANIFDPCIERPPVNPLLVAFREHVARTEQYAGAVADKAAGILGAGVSSVFDHATPEQIDHARKVLTRLAALK